MSFRNGEGDVEMLPICQDGIRGRLSVLDHTYKYSGPEPAKQEKAGTANRCYVEFYSSRVGRNRDVTWQVLCHFDLDEDDLIQRLLQACLRNAAPPRGAFARQPLAISAGTDWATPPEGRPAYWVDPLTSREIEILRCLAVGLSNRQIAHELILAEGTVKFHVHNVLEKLGVHNRTQAVFEAKNLNII
jgi:ATP/maltotriose-dependent transcriptional regulator MalT